VNRPAWIPSHVDLTCKQNPDSLATRACSSARPSCLAMLTFLKREKCWCRVRSHWRLHASSIHPTRRLTRTDFPMQWHGVTSCNVCTQHKAVQALNFNLQPSRCGCASSWFRRQSWPSPREDGIPIVSCYQAYQSFIVGVQGSSSMPDLTCKSIPW